MRQSAIACLATAALVFSAAGLCVPSVLAQQAGAGKSPAAATDDRTPETLLKDYIHFVKVRSYEAAAGAATELFAKNLSPAEFVKVVEDSREQARFDDAVQLGLKIAAIEDVSGKMLRTFERGKLDRARDPEQIKKNIELLAGPVLARKLGHDRLVFASEYAMPQLLTAFLDGGDPLRREEVRGVMVDLGKSAVIPLVTALPNLDGAQQEQVIDVLRQIPYKTSAPFIAELRATTANGSVRAASERALTELGSTESIGDLSGMFQSLAEGFYSHRSDLQSFPAEDFQLLWEYKPDIGLYFRPIVTGLFYEAMAMRYAEKALRLRTDNTPALGLWVAANFKREIRTPQGYDNPSYGKDRREAMYYAVAAGSDVVQAVLGRGLDASDTPLIRRAIAALEKSAGGATLWSATGAAGRKPLPESLSYPNRRVQYEAALALAAAQPREAFQGSDRVVPTLSSAIREASSRLAVVLASDNETYQSVRSILEKGKYTVLPFGRTLGDIAAPLAESPAVDLTVVANQRGESVAAAIQEIRGTTKVSAVPILALTSSDAYRDLLRTYERDATIAVRQSAITEAQVLQSAEDLVRSASGGPITEDEARLYSARCLAALRDLAVSGNAVFDVGDSASALIAALNEKTGATKMDVAEVLSRVGQERAQGALMDGALSASGAERIALLGKVADSAKRYGNLLAQRYVDQLVRLAGSADNAEATAAAATLGALNLPNARIVPLILGDKQ